MTAEKKAAAGGRDFGGRSGEHGIAGIRRVGDCSLDPDKYEAVLIGIGKDGRWFLGSPRRCCRKCCAGQRVMLTPTPMSPDAARGASGAWT
jgi:hypothetical protein